MGIHDNFLDMGGDSLLASQIITRAMISSSTSVPIAVFYQTPTVAAIALAITQQQLESMPDDLIEVILVEAKRKHPSVNNPHTPLLM